MFIFVAYTKIEDPPLPLLKCHLAIPTKDKDPSKGQVLASGSQIASSRWCGTGRGRTGQGFLSAQVLTPAFRGSHIGFPPPTLSVLFWEKKQGFDSFSRPFSSRILRIPALAAVSEFVEIPPSPERWGHELRSKVLSLTGVCWAGGGGTVNSICRG